MPMPVSATAISIQRPPLATLRARSRTSHSLVNLQTLLRMMGAFAVTPHTLHKELPNSRLQRPSGTGTARRTNDHHRRQTRTNLCRSACRRAGLALGRALEHCLWRLDRRGRLQSQTCLYLLPPLTGDVTQRYVEASKGSTECEKNKAHGNANAQKGELFTRHKLGNFVQQCNSGNGNTHRATDQQQVATHRKVNHDGNRTAVRRQPVS